MELVARLMDELGISREQAEGAAGAVLQLAQARIPPAEFVRVADTIPAISDVIGKSPRYVIPPSGNLLTVLSRLLGGLGGLAPLAEPFAKLRLDRSMIRPTVASVQRHFSAFGDPVVAGLLEAALR